MYKNIIDVRKDIPQDILKTLAGIADRAFDNRAGKVENASDTPYRFIYRGGDREYAYLEVGMLILKKQPDFLPYLEVWNWIDEDDPDENGNLLKLFIKNHEVNLWL